MANGSNIHPPRFKRKRWETRKKENHFIPLTLLAMDRSKEVWTLHIRVGVDNTSKFREDVVHSSIKLKKLEASEIFVRMSG